MDELEDGGWFIGIVDDVNDPKKLGRVKVRILDDYDQSVDSEDIPWAIVLGPTTGAAFLGVGHAVVGMMPGSRVIGFYLDGDKKTKPLVMGTLPFILKGDELDHSTSSIARGSGPIKKDYLDYEPKTEYASQYPLNSTITTKSGHVIEVDDTPKAERLHIYHKSGAYIEIFPDGKIVTKSPTDNIEITIGDKTIVSDDGNININANKNIDLISSDGEIGVVANKDVVVVSTDGSVILSGKNTTEIRGSIVEINADNAKVKADTSISGNVTIKGVVKIVGLLTVNGRTI